MTRILADLPDEDIEKLDALAARAGCSRAAAIRDAVRLYLSQSIHSGDWIARGAGHWKDRADMADAVAYQRAMREDRDTEGDS